MKRKRNNHIDPENDLNNVTIIESPIDLSVQKEYHDLPNSIDFDNVDHGEVSNKADKLFIGNTPIEAKNEDINPPGSSWNNGIVKDTRKVPQDLRRKFEGLGVIVPEGMQNVCRLLCHKC